MGCQESKVDPGPQPKEAGPATAPLESKEERERGASAPSSLHVNGEQWKADGVAPRKLSEVGVKSLLLEC